MISSLSNLLTPHEMENLLAQRFKALRLAAGYKRATLAQRAGVSEASLKRFETCGQVSLKNLLRLAHAVDRLPEFAGLFHPARITSMAQLREQGQKKTFKRGRI